MSKDALMQRINYCYIPELERYYWINSITYEEGYWVENKVSEKRIFILIQKE